MCILDRAVLLHEEAHCVLWMELLCGEAHCVLQMKKFCCVEEHIVCYG
jgi:hypothetical protein